MTAGPLPDRTLTLLIGALGAYGWGHALGFTRPFSEASSTPAP